MDCPSIKDEVLRMVCRKAKGDTSKEVNMFKIWQQTDMEMDAFIDAIITLRDEGLIKMASNEVILQECELRGRACSCYYEARPKVV